MDREVFETIARVEREHWFFVARRRIVDALLRHYCPPGSERRILDVGTGTGAMLEVLSRYGVVTGIESSADASSWYGELVRDGVSLAHSTATSLPFVARSFELITAFDVLEHIEDDAASAKEIHRALRDGGTLLCTVPAHPWLWSDFDDYSRHCRRYTAATLRRLLTRADFQIERMFYVNSILFAPIATLRVLTNAVERARVFFGTKSNRAPRGTGMETPPAPINKILTSLFAAEARWAPYVNTPFGVTLVCIARKR